ncbi:ECF subfamily RNA polymerase sigma-24 factor [Kalymmatonema gypsitolerans NIES-4073]|nr:ECF subfamily RNA polymerase sigma-24 factor [Scytonema sp. NIES-4073]
MFNSRTVSDECLWDCSEDLGKGFWQQWQQNRDYLYRCCIKWMGGNPTDAEDALSRAMLKAWEKVQKYAGEIDNFKGWLSTLTHNLCVDIHRERSRGANRVEDIEVYASSEEQGLVSFEDTPESAMETGEKRIVIRRAIDNLPSRLRQTFILHFYQELSYPEIAQLQEISYQNVCKRISQARKILREELRGYFIGEDGTDKDSSVPPAATESAIEEMSEGNAGVEPIVGETVTLSDSAADALPQATEVEEVEIVVGGEPQEAALSVQQRESAMVAAVADRFLEVKRDCCRWEIEAALCGMQSAPILALAQLDAETGSWGNPRQALPRRQEKPEVGERGMGGISATVLLSWFLSSNQFSIPSLEYIWDKDRGSFLESTLASNEPYPITQGDALRQGLRLRCLIMPAVGILNKLYSQVREMRSLFELRWDH